MELIEYYRVLRRRWLLVVIPMLLVPAVAVIVALGEPLQYVGDATIVVSEIRTSNPLQGQMPGFSSYSPDRDINTHLQAIRTADVLETAAARLEEPMDWRSIEGAISLSNPPNSNVIVIKVTQDDPERASLMAAAVASAYADWTRERREEVLAFMVEQAERELQATLDRTIELPTEATVTVYSSESGQDIELAVFPQRLVGANAYENLSWTLSQMSFADIPYVGLAWVLESGVVNESPIGPNPKRDGALGVVVGLVFGVGMAFLVEYIEKQKALERASVVATTE